MHYPFTVMIAVTGKPGTIFIETPRNMTVSVNTTVHIPCRPNGTTIIGWLINDEPLRAPSYPRHISPGDPNLFQLNVYCAHEVNGTVFQCFTRRNDEVFSSERAIITIKEGMVAKSATTNFAS